MSDLRSHRRYRNLRLRILLRDGYRCQIRGADCTLRATEVDHVVPLAAGGSVLAPSNLRASCRTCNRAKGASVFSGGTLAERLPSRWQSRSAAAAGSSRNAARFVREGALSPGDDG